MVAEFLAVFCRRIGLTTPFHTIARLASSAADGSFIFNSTVLSSTARYDATEP